MAANWSDNDFKALISVWGDSQIQKQLAGTKKKSCSVSENKSNVGRDVWTGVHCKSVSVKNKKHAPRLQGHKR